MQIFYYSIFFMVSWFCLICLKSLVFLGEESILSPCTHNISNIIMTHQSFIIIREENIVCINIFYQFTIRLFNVCSAAIVWFLFTTVSHTCFTMNLRTIISCDRLKNMIVSTVLTVIVRWIKIDNIVFCIPYQQSHITICHNMIMIVEVILSRLEFEWFLCRFFEFLEECSVYWCRIRNLIDRLEEWRKQKEILIFCHFSCIPPQFYLCTNSVTSFPIFIWEILSLVYSSESSSMTVILIDKSVRKLYLTQICKHNPLCLVHSRHEELWNISCEPWKIEIVMIANIVTIEDVAIILKIICPYLMTLLFPIPPNSSGSCKKIRKNIFSILYYRRYGSIEKLQKRKFWSDIIHDISWLACQKTYLYYMNISWNLQIINIIFK